MKQVEFSITEMEEFLFEELTDLGYAPGEAEIEAVAEIMFDYFVMKMMELEDEDDDD